jgi:hypothetical protein
MPKVDLVATGPFTYNTRRLMAGDAFQARSDMDARILTRVRKVAEVPKPAKAPAVVLPTTEEVLTAGVVEEAPKAAPKPKRPARRPTAKRKPAKK